MNKIPKISIALSVAILSAGCVGHAHLIPGPERVSPDAAGRIKSVAVISTCGDTLNLESTGAISHTDNLFDAKEWGFNSQIFDEIATVMGNQYTIKPVTYEASYFEPDLKALYPLGLDISAAVRDHAKLNAGDSVDAYLVVWAARRRDAVLGTPAELKGIGLYQFSFLTREDSAAFAACTMTVLDGHSFEVLGESDVEVPSDPAGSIFQGAFGVPIDNSLWAEKTADISPEQKQKLQQIFKAILHAEIEPTLRVLRLVH
ncbi:MAG: hypothetical protein KGO48_01545 [Alphaproteobacteria bacterium]|nr:hypothetical protein [Alphaproteobacteria bacterium]